MANESTGGLTSLNIIAGGSLGLVIGTLAGLSASPVVGALLGTLSTGAMAFLTLRSETATASNLTRIGAFGLACLFGSMSGVYLRANNILGLTPKRFIAQLEAAGITPEDSIKIYLHATTNISEKQIQDNVESENASPDNKGVMFGSTDTQRDELCEMLQKNTDWTQITNNIRNAFPKWLNVTQAVSQTSLSYEDKRRLLIALVNIP